MASARARAAIVGGVAAATVAVLLLAARGPRSAREEAPRAPPTRGAGPAPTPQPSLARASGERTSGAPAGSAAAAAPAGAPRHAETALTEEVRALVDTDPAAAVAIAEEGERRFPDGALADERSYLKMRALVHLGRIGLARGEAEVFFERFPGSSFGEDAFRLTGVHPRPPTPSGRGGGR